MDTDARVKVTFRVSEDVADELERGRIAHQFPSQVEYVSSLILAGAGRVSGLVAVAPEAFGTAATDGRVSNAIANAISFINQGEPVKAVEKLRIAQDVILKSLIQKKPMIEKAIDERLRIRGGGDDWSEAPR